MINKDIKISIPKLVQYILDVLKDNDYEGYIVGGCLRDSLLNREPKDWDIATNAMPETVIKIFEALGFKVIPTGLKHGTVTVLIKEKAFEITTYRSNSFSDREGNFATTLKEDLCKRDLTINAMAYNEDEGLIDYFNGLTDIKENRIKAIASPEERFSEDPLRMLRAYRFSAELNFTIEDTTKDSIKKLSDKIKKVSIERIREEFNKILLSKNPQKIAEVNSCGLLKHFIPEFDICEKTSQDNPYHIYTVGEHLIKTVQYIERQLSLKLTMFFHDICKPQCKTVDDKGVDHFYNYNEASAVVAEKILKRMKYDNQTIEKVTTLIRYHHREISSNKSIRKLLSLIGEENFKDLLKVKEADIKAQNPRYYEDRHNKLIEIENKFKDIISSKACFTIKDLALNGKDLICLGVKEGKEIGIILNNLLELVLEEPELNHKSILTKLVEKKYLFQSTYL